MFKLISTYILLLFTVSSTAQSVDTFKISGIVVSAFDKSPIPDGTIMFTKTKGYRCDSSGRFTLYGLTSGQHKLTFSTFGYPTSDTILYIDKADITNFVWYISTSCNWQYSRQRALDDIKQGNANFLVQGGIAPVIYTTDKDFKMKYSVGYDVFGCIAPDMEECLRIYNRTIVEHLDQKFGKKWRKTVRKDVIGLKSK